MIEISFMKQTPHGNLKGILRVINNILYFKYNNTNYAIQAIESMKKKGAIIEFSSKQDWIRVDIFRDEKYVKLGSEEINLEEEEPDQVERKLADFYIEQYRKANFFVEELNK